MAASAGAFVFKDFCGAGELEKVRVFLERIQKEIPSKKEVAASLTKQLLENIESGVGVTADLAASVKSLLPPKAFKVAEGDLYDFLCDVPSLSAVTGGADTDDEVTSPSVVKGRGLEL